MRDSNTAGGDGSFTPEEQFALFFHKLGCCERAADARRFVAFALACIGETTSVHGDAPLTLVGDLRSLRAVAAFDAGWLNLWT